VKLSELREELYARGFQDLEASEEGKTRANRWINQAYREITDAQPWTFLEATKEGTAPLTISDLRRVMSFVNLTNESDLWPATRQEIMRRDPDLSQTGIGLRWYQESETELKVWPVDTSSKFQVRYNKVPVELKEDADKPLIPEMYQWIIIEGAALRGYKGRDNFEAANLTRQEWDRGMKQMIHALRDPNYDANRKILRTGYGADYLGWSW
jgi:hypothetical protein